MIDRLCSIHCTHDEIAEVLRISEDTLSRACKRVHGCTAKEYIAKKRKLGKRSLRRKMWEAADSGNVAMQIFLAKNWLGMANDPEPDIPKAPKEQHTTVMDDSKPEE